METRPHDAILFAVLLQVVPLASRDILIAPTGFLFIAILLFWTSKRRDGRWIGTMQIVGIALGLIALFYGTRTLWDLWAPATGVFYRAGIIGKGRLLASHYVAFGVPLAVLSIMATIVLRQRRDVLRERDE